MEIRNLILAGLLVIMFYACNVSPKPIDYGKEACNYCEMTIVDKVHGAEIVTFKGKIYKFDSAECMVRFLGDFDTSVIQLYLTNQYSEPEALIDATKATFLISENLPSPMGANLTAFEAQKEAEKTRAEKGGTLYSWEELLDRLK